VLRLAAELGHTWPMDKGTTPAHDAGALALASLPIAEQWFVRTSADHGVSLITEPHVHPLLRCNVWHVRGARFDLVIDTALGVSPIRSVIEQQDLPELVVVATHSHGDHVGGLHEFDQRIVHALEAGDVAAASMATVEVGHYPESVLAPYRDAGYEFDDLFIDAVPTGGLAATVFEVAAAPATRIVEDGDVIDIGDRVFEVMHLPGHSPGSIGVWEQATGILFSGDAVYDGPLLDELEGANKEDYLATMERLRQLPVSVVHGGHEPSFGRDRLLEICDTYLASA